MALRKLIQDYHSTDGKAKDKKLYNLFKAVELEMVAGTGGKPEKFEPVESTTAIEDRHAIETALSQDDHDKIKFYLSIGDDGTIARALENLSVFIELIHGEVDTKVSQGQLANYPTTEIVMANLDTVNARIDAIETALSRMSYGIDKTALVTRAVSETTGTKVIYQHHLYEETKVSVAFSTPWLYTKKQRAQIVKDMETSYVTKLSEKFLGYDTSYYNEVYSVAVSGAHDIHYKTEAGVDVGSTDVVYETVNAISDPDDDAADVVLKPYSQVKGVTKIAQMLTGVALAMYGLPGTTIAGVMSFGEDEVKQIVSAAVDYVETSTRFPKREHLTNVVQGNVVIATTHLGTSNEVGLQIAEQDHPRGPWSKFDIRNAFSQGLTWHLVYNHRYFWKTTTIARGNQDLPLDGNGDPLQVTATVVARVPLPNDVNTVSMYMDTDELAVYSAGSWSASSSLPSEFTIAFSP
jgi:hypothetical protein